MSSFSRYFPVGAPRTPPTGTLIGNLEPVDHDNLTEIQPSGLVVGKEYLLINNDTLEKIKATYLRFEELNDAGTDEVNQFEYIFKDKFSELVIEGADMFDEDDDNYATAITEPYADELTFDDEYGVFLPKTKDILMSKTSKNLPNDDAYKHTIGFTGGKKARRSRKSRLSKRRKSRRTVKSRRSEKPKSRKTRRVRK